jgi:hypothetical protein
LSTIGDPELPPMMSAVETKSTGALRSIEPLRSSQRFGSAHWSAC